MSDARYPFDSESILVLNRVHAAANGLDRRSYDIKVHPLAAQLWVTAETQNDFSAEQDVVLEMNEYARMLDAWNIVNKPFGQGQFRTTEQQTQAEACYEQAMNVILELENRLWIACCVTNAMVALEGSPANIWAAPHMLNAVTREFLPDRKKVAQEARDILCGNRAFDALWARPTG